MTCDQSALAQIVLRCFRSSLAGKMAGLAFAGFIVFSLAVVTVRSVPDGFIPVEDSVLLSQMPCSASACHSSSVGGTFNFGGSVDINGLPADFVPGNTYDLSLTVTGGRAVKFGFQVVSVFSDRTQAGTLTPVTANLTKKSNQPGYGDVHFLSHSIPLDVNTVNFRWTAPADPKGPVDFRFAANSANGDFSNTNDSIFFSTAMTAPQQIMEVPPDLVFPHFANGEVSGVPNKARIVLRNNGDEALSGQIKFRDTATDEPTTMPVNGVEVEMIEYALAPWATLDVETDGTGPLKSGAVEVFNQSGPTAQLTGTEIFSILGNFVSVGSAPTVMVAQLYVSQNAEERTGAAVYNPDPENPVTLDLILLDNTGMERSRIQGFILNAQEHLAAFMDEAAFFQAFLQANPEFQGTLNIHVTSGGGVSLVGLIQKTGNGALIAVSPSATAFGP